VIEMRRGKVWARSNFGEAVMFNFILPVKEDA
jgi:signal transduction histidine kinase